MQAVANISDTDISSQNGKMQTHSLAFIMAQPCNGNETFDKETFVTLKKKEIEDSSILNTIIQHYTGPKRPKILPDLVPQWIHTAIFIEDQPAIKKNKWRTRLTVPQRHSNLSISPWIPWLKVKGQKRKRNFRFQEDKGNVYSTYWSLAIGSKYYGDCNDWCRKTHTIDGSNIHHFHC